MMRTLAELILRGRWHAMVVALVGSVFPLLAIFTPAAIGLVTLRKGWHEGLFITVGTMLVVVVVLQLEGFGQFAGLINMGAVLVAYTVAVVLRYTVSWGATLAALIAFSMFASLVIGLSNDNPAEALVNAYSKVLDAQPEETQTELKTALSALTAPILVGAFAFSMALYAILGVLVARWWQAMLFNPGGLRQELHNLRLKMPLAIACVLGFSYCEFRGEDYFYWEMLFLLPLLIAGLGLIHWLVGRLKWGRPSLIAVYLGMLVLPPLLLLAATIGLTDVWLDYRKRFNLMRQ